MRKCKICDAKSQYEFCHLCAEYIIRLLKNTVPNEVDRMVEIMRTWQ